MADESFYRDIERFNAIYKLPANERPTMLPPERLRNFHDILAEEVREGAVLAARYEALRAQKGDDLSREDGLSILTELSDWLGDVVVYCASEAKRWGIPLDGVLKVIMESNFSKLGADGEPIYDERGKVMKGPEYWKPEPKIRELLEPGPGEAR